MTRSRGVLRRTRRRLAAAGLVVALVATGAGCGSDDDGDSADEPTAAESWADDLCTSVGAWTTTMEEARTTLSEPRELSAADLEATIDQVSSSTSTLVGDLGDLGAPDTEAGDAAQERLTALSDEMESQSAVVEEAAGSEPGNLQQLLDRVSTVTGAAAAMLSEAKAAVADLRELDGAQELQDAIEGTASCQDLRG
ncbi:hypothetical protein [Nocardioides sediminis]|uniref:hypothetical protein n=1 Tax=Nocardioides sediminis TaxID=433648 RepID=UPI00131EF7E0|nr:hypothetical protein [Nocardioides sediminis]